MLGSLPRYIPKSNSTHRLQILRLMVRLSRASSTLPLSLFVRGVRAGDCEPVVYGGFSDIYRATYQGKAVALKRLRVFQRDENDGRSYRVSYIFFPLFSVSNLL